MLFCAFPLLQKTRALSALLCVCISRLVWFKWGFLNFRLQLVISFQYFCRPCVTSRLLLQEHFVVLESMTVTWSNTAMAIQARWEDRFNSFPAAMLWGTKPKKKNNFNSYTGCLVLPSPQCPKDAKRVGHTSVCADGNDFVSDDSSHAGHNHFSTLLWLLLPRSFFFFLPVYILQGWPDS